MVCGRSRSITSQAKLSRERKSQCNIPMPGSSPNDASASRASASKIAYRYPSIALGGVTASRGDAVRVNILLPNLRQWSGVRGRSLKRIIYGQLMPSGPIELCSWASQDRISSPDLALAAWFGLFRFLRLQRNWEVCFEKLCWTVKFFVDEFNRNWQRNSG